MRSTIHRFAFGQRSLSFLLLFIGWLFTPGSNAIYGQATVTAGKSYINVSRPTGGTFLPGDTIEVRATIAVSGGDNSSASKRINAVRYNDTINLAKFTYIPNSLQMLSNEGHLQHAFSDAANSDSANIDAATGRLRFNIGNGSSSCNVLTAGTSTTNAGNLWGALWPSFYGGTCIRMYVYRVQIKTIPSVVDIDTTIRLSAGNFRYRVGNSASDQTSGFAPYLIKISPNYGLCSNSIGTNAILGESGGTFGSGVPQNRTGGTSFVPPPYTFSTFGTGTPNDNFYGLANRTSADGSTNGNAAFPGATRVFTVWDIIGDHTGATDPALGNPPTNTGYAVIINASYQTNLAFTQNIGGLCEETYYEFSAWFRNICRRCGCDSSGIGASAAGYTYSPGKDSSGVRPNLTFQIDGQDYYTTGNLPYTGLWEKKGFVFRTKPGQNSFTVTIRNNAPGGGGNDWAVDDIGVATCLPNMRYSPSVTPNVCKGNPLTLHDTVRSYFDNYVYYKWQKSANGGTSWTDVTSPSGPVVPYWNGSEWEYVSNYTITPAFTTIANAGDLYRLIVATSTDNLADANCRSTDNANIVTLNVLDCGNPLSADLISFNANLQAGKAFLQWTTSGEAEPVFYDVERSEDGVNFSAVAMLNGQGNSDLNHYQFLDPPVLRGNEYYRIKIRDNNGRIGYSRTIVLTAGTEDFAFISMVNPFSGSISFTLSSSRAGQADCYLLDANGKPLRRENYSVINGVNALTLNDTGALPAGIYVLRLEMNGQFIYKKLVKKN